MDINNSNISTDEYIQSAEEFIDSHVEKVRMNEIIEKVMVKVRQELNSSYSIYDRRNKKLQTELKKKNEMLEHLQNEINFLRDENQGKTKIISGLTEKISQNTFFNTQSINKDVSFSCNNNEQEITKTNSLLGNIDYQEDCVKSNEQLINDQIIAYRLARRKEFTKISSLNTIKENTKKVITNTTKEKATSVNTELIQNKIQSVKNVIVCGDSMINGIDNNGISGKHHKSIVKSFSGSTSKDLVHFVKPLVSKKPDILITHVGTNDITKNIDTVKYLNEVIAFVKANSPSTEIILSNICKREDRNVEKERKHINDGIRNLARKYGLRSIDNNNIDSSCLSKKKLHLNRKGLAKLAVNIKSEVTKCIERN